MQAAFQRTLQSGRQYERYFSTAKLQRTDPVVKDGDTFDTIELMAKVVKQYRADTSTLAPVLKGNSLKATCENIWNFAYHHFQYTPDKSGVEQLRRPARSWADRRAGIDCDCYSILVSSILLNLGIEHKLRKTKYDGKADYQHIYVVVPAGGTAYYTIDPVTDRFDHEVPYSAKFDKTMQIQVLNGLNDSPAAASAARPARVAQGSYSRFGFSAEFVGLAAEAEQVRQQALQSIRTTALQGLAAASVSNVQASQTEIADLASVTGQSHEEATADAAALEHLSASFIERVRQSLINTGYQIDALKDAPAPLLRLRTRIKALLGVWGDEAKRTALFDEYSALEQQENGPVAPGMAGLGNWFGDAWDGIKQAASWVGGAVSTAAGAVKQAAGWVADKVKQGASAVAEGIKNAAKWVGQEALALGKLLVKYNPLSILIRGGLRIAFRVNLFYMSGRLGHGYYSQEAAAAKGLDVPEWQKAKDQLNKVKAMWDGLQGDAGILRDSILVGYLSGEQPKLGTREQALDGLGCLRADASTLEHIGADASIAHTSTLNGLGEPVTAASTAAASGFIATIITWLKNVNWERLINVATSIAEKLKLKKAYDSVPAVTENTLLPASEADYAANRAKYENQQTGSSSLVLPALGVAGLLGLYLTQKKK